MVDGSSNDAQYQGKPDSGSTITDEGTRPGPAGGPTLDTIKAAKWIHTLKRSGGSGGTHNLFYGNNVDGVTARAVTLTTAYQNFFTLSELPTVVPQKTEYFQHGFGTEAGQDIFCAEIWAFILNVSDA